LYYLYFHERNHRIFFSQLTSPVFFFLSLPGRWVLRTNLPKNLYSRNCIFPTMPMLIKNTTTLWTTDQSDSPTLFPYRCETCGKNYQHRATLLRHTRHECGKEPRIQCPYCSAKMKQRGHVYRHIRQCHQGRMVYVIDHNWGFVETRKATMINRYQCFELPTLALVDSHSAIQFRQLMQFRNSSRTLRCIIFRPFCYDYLYHSSVFMDRDKIKLSVWTIWLYLYETLFIWFSNNAFCNKEILTLFIVKERRLSNVNMNALTW